MDNPRPNVEIKNASYENIFVDCPHCNREIIYNRRSDIGSLRPISGKEVDCLYPDCGLPMWINSDVVNEAYEMLLFECYGLIKRKQYMACVLSVAQAYEMFFNLFLRVSLLYRPFAGSGRAGRLEQVNRASELLHTKTKQYAFDAMRSTFLTQIVKQVAPIDLAASEVIIGSLPDKPSAPKDAAIQALADPKLVTLLMGVKSSSIGSLRNSVVHKTGYRPTKEEAESALEEAMELLETLGAKLGLHDDLNWYSRTT